MTFFTSLKVFLLALILSFTPLALFAESAGSSQGATPGTESQEYRATVNINTASVEELADGLSGIGLKRAEAIVEYRTSNGSFSTKAQLMEVKGIGEAIFDKNKSNILL